MGWLEDLGNWLNQFKAPSPSSSPAVETANKEETYDDWGRGGGGFSVNEVKEEAANQQGYDRGEIEQLADETIRGDYGNGQDRQNALGDKYDVVQATVNSRLMGGNPEDYFDGYNSLVGNKPKEAEQQEVAPDVSKTEQDQQAAPSTYIGDNGMLMDLSGPQANDVGAALNELGDLAKYWEVDDEVNKKYEQYFDQEQEANLNNGGMGLAGGEIDNSGAATVDHFDGKSTNSNQARAAYMTRDAALNYADLGFVEDADGLRQWLEENPNAEAISKEFARNTFGFQRYETNAIDKAANIGQNLGDSYNNSLAQLSNARENLGYDAELSKDKKIHVDNDVTENVLKALNDADYVYEFPDGSMISQDDFDTEQPFVYSNGSLYAQTKDGARAFIAETNDAEAALNQFINGNRHLSPEGITISTRDGEMNLNEQELKDAFTDNRIWSALTGSVDAEEINQMKKDNGTKADYGPLNFFKPKSAMSLDETNPIIDNIASGNLVPQLADLLLGSAAYLNRYTAVPAILSSTGSAFNGVDTMNKGYGDYQINDDRIQGGIAQGAAGIGEMALGGAVGGTGRGIFELALDKIAPGLVKSAPGRVLRGAATEGMEEVATSPGYEMALQGFDNMYGTDVTHVDEDTGATIKDTLKNGNVLPNDRFRNWAETIPNDFLGGALMGGPMITVEEMTKLPSYMTRNGVRKPAGLAAKEKADIDENGEE